MTTVTGTKYRADHVGSLLRPPEVLEAHAAFGQKRISREQLTEIEDRAILAALDLQKQVGLDIYSDGEYRRGNWAGDFISSVDGYISAEVPRSLHWRLPDEIGQQGEGTMREDRKSTRLNSSHVAISYAVFCLKKKKKKNNT